MIQQANLSALIHPKDILSASKVSVLWCGATVPVLRELIDYLILHICTIQKAMDYEKAWTGVLWEKKERASDQIRLIRLTSERQIGVQMREERGERNSILGKGTYGKEQT